ncbi:MAG: two-component regulator propeller domain-containing protein [Vicinamibacteria bacterium]
MSRVRDAFGSVAILVAAGSMAPLFALDPQRSPDQYASRVWGKRDGLLGSWVYAILPSRPGYLWLGTGDGLLRFDGVRFTAYDRQTSPGLPADNVLALHEGRDGRLWVGTLRGLAVGDARGSRPFERVEGVGSTAVESIAEDSDGTVWAMTEEAVWHLEGNRVTRLGPEQGLPGEGYRAVCSDPTGGLWLATNKGLARIEGLRATETYGVRDGLASNEVMSVLVDAEGTLWVGTGQGLARRAKGGAFEQVEAVGARIVRALLEDRDGGLWAGTRDGLLRASGGPRDLIGRGAGLADEHISALAQDLGGNLWVGTEAGGLARLRDGRARVYGKAQGLTHEVIWSVLEGLDGSVWIATDGGGLDRLRGDRASLATTEEGFANESVYALFEDHAGTLWFSTGAHGLCRLAGGHANCITKPFSDDLVRCLLEDKQGQLWAGTSAGLVRINGTVAEPMATEDAHGPTVTSLAEGPSGMLWVGTKSGLWQVEHGTLRRVVISGKPHSDPVGALHVDVDGTLWLGTVDAGLQRLRDGHLASVTSRHGLPSDSVLSVLDDGAGRMWLSTGQGIVALARSDVEAAANGSAARIKAVVITEAEGLRDRECSGGVQPSAWMGRDGRLWYPTIGGVAVVDPRHARMNAKPLSILIEEIVADGRRLNPDGDLALAAGTRHLEIRYSAPSFAAPERLRFEHRLEGLDPAFVAASSDRVAHYTTLGPGQYRFKVRAANEDGVWSEEEAPLSFTVRPYVWQTLWFYALSGGLLVVAAATAFNLRVRGLRLHEQELQRRVAEEVAKVEVLSGLLPICAWCKKVRDDAGYWAQIEMYISARSKVAFTHGICPECASTLRSGLVSKGAPEK